MLSYINNKTIKIIVYVYYLLNILYYLITIRLLLLYSRTEKDIKLSPYLPRKIKNYLIEQQEISKIKGKGLNLFIEMHIISSLY